MYVYTLHCRHVVIVVVVEYDDIDDHHHHPRTVGLCVDAVAIANIYTNSLTSSCNIVAVLLVPPVRVYSPLVYI